MPKNIVILCDGTSNEISENRTNILRLYGCLRKSDDQIVFYDPGVGTFGGENDWFRLSRKTKELWGLATGWGLDTNVKQAYRFLVENYRHGQTATKTRKAVEQDNIYIFGFSRGAYTARVLAGFIHAFGIMDKNQINLLDYAYRTYKGISDFDESDNGDPNAAFLKMRLYERALTPHRPDIKALGLFDTVSSVIEMGRVRPQLKTHPFTMKNPSVAHVRHAVAIDEQRTMFNPQLWTAGGKFTGPPFKKQEPVDQDVKETWFSGSHGDVGGGYPEALSAQAKIPLAWMLDEMKPLGLKTIPQTIRRIVLGTEDDKYIEPGAGQPINGSMTGGWPLVEFLPRRIPSTSMRRGESAGNWYIPRFDHRRIAADATIHASVFERMQIDKNYRPPNLPDNAKPG